eukprot:jgi/Tetstr1/453195/TSEL_040212.t1
MAVAGKTTVLPVQTGVSWDHDALPREGVYCSAEPGSLIHELVAECPSLSEAANWYRAPWFMANGHILTVWSALRRDAPEVRNAYGVLNLRGCGQLDVTSPQLFSARRGSTADLQYALSMLKEELPAGNLIFAAGWSNVPFDMHLPSQAMETRLGKFIYDRNFLRSLLPKVDSFLNRWSTDLSHIDAAAVRDSQSLKDMEIHLISPMFGYKSVEEYYRDASTKDAIARITLPTLCISAMDDPIALSAGLPLQAFSQSAAAALACTRSGGHIGWPDLNRGSRASWTEAVLLQFFDAIVRRKEK